MNRIEMLVALVIVVFGVSVMISAQFGTSLVIATALLAGGALAHKFIQSFATDVPGDFSLKTAGKFLSNVARNLMRLAIGAGVIALMVISSIRFFGG